MEAIPFRVLRNRPGEFEAILARERAVILNKDNRPLAIAIEVGEATLEETVRLVTQLRAQLAVSRMRSQAQQRGLSEMTDEDVDTVVQEARSARRR